MNGQHRVGGWKSSEVEVEVTTLHRQNRNVLSVVPWKKQQLGSRSTGSRVLSRFCRGQFVNDTIVQWQKLEGLWRAQAS